MDLFVYTHIAFIIVGIDSILGIKALRSGKQEARFLSLAILTAAITCASYLSSLLTSSYFAMKLSLAAFFICIPSMLLLLSVYLDEFLGIEQTKLHVSIRRILVGCTLVDTVFELINPFCEIVMKFDYHPEYSMAWTYVPQLPYKLHLVLCYLIILIIAVNVGRTCLKSPTVYRRKYLILILGMIFAVAFNAVFLCMQSQGMLDYSQTSYSLLAIILYWSQFHNKQRGMLNQIRQVILDELGHPVVLFGENNVAAICNKSIEFLIPDWNPKVKYHLSDFIESCGFDEALLDASESTYFQWVYSKEDGETSTYRVDYRIIKDKKGFVIGRLFVFTDTSLEMDLLTGFHSRNSFEHHWHGDPDESEFPIAVAVCDINKLGIINKLHGEQEGDACIRSLAGYLRQRCPDNSYFARSNDANLLVVSPNTTADELRTCINEAKQDFANSRSDLGPLGMQSATSEASKESPSILEAAESAEFSMRSRKLMDGSSAHSSLLDSLAQVLLESDEATEAHVRRTNKLGAELGKRMGFNDLQLSNLSLLCLLHDIGKLGIPIEILNKPGRLNEREWEVMQSHVLRGYRIAKASNELEGIANDILHHHESWDGSGYPDALSKESIPILSRVIAIVDAYDAMTNDRPYHNAISDAQARAELKRCAGTQFDPAMVSEFLQMMNESQPISNEQLGKADKEIEEKSMGRPLGAKPTSQAEKFAHKDDSLVNPLQTSVYTIDDQCRIIKIDKNFTELTGYTEEDFESYQLTQWDLLPERERKEYERKVKGFIQNEGRVPVIEHRIQRKDGTCRDVFCIGINDFDPISKKHYSIINVVDAIQTNAVALTQKIERESAKRSLDLWADIMRKDSLTGLLNHEAFVNEIEDLLLNKDQKVCMIILDVDDFKGYNDTWGHGEGDRMLRLIANSLNENVEGIGFAGRLGGDEFSAALIFNPRTGDLADKAKAQVEKLYLSILQEAEAAELPSSISMGAYISKQTDSFRDVYQHADQALYQAKEAGRRCFKIYTE